MPSTLETVLKIVGFIVLAALPLVILWLPFSECQQLLARP